MRESSSIALLAFLACVAIGRSAIVTMETTAASSSHEEWEWGARADPEAKMRLLFAVKQTNLETLESELVAVSDPDSARYGMHLTNDDVHALIAPLQSHVNAVEAFARARGFKPISMTPNSDIIAIDVTVAEAESLLGATYYDVTHAASDTTVRRATSYALPEEVAAAVDFVSPTVHVPPAPSVVAKNDVAAASSSGGNTPKQLRKLYSVDVEGKAADNSMAVTAFLKQYYSKKSLHKFWSEYCDGITCGKGDPDTEGDAIKGFTSGIESMLDIESITGVAGNVSSAFWGFSGASPDNRENEPFMSWLALVSNTSDADVPKLFSTSYGENENSWSLEAASRLNVEFQKAGARGISLLFASGDYGANCGDGKLLPTTPASSPWVTAVGGTGGSTPGEEYGIGLSSGGFSNRWPIPSWQKDAVEAYMKDDGKDFPSGTYNKTGRGYPDIAAQGQDFTVIAGGTYPGVAGTSCAAPTASGVIALLNDARLQAGKPPLGFLNIWIYKNMDAWNDIVKGASSNGCSGSEGWPAETGWDAVTGVGTPNYKKLLDALM